jgi:adenylate cyclase class 2
MPAALEREIKLRFPDAAAARAAVAAAGAAPRRGRRLQQDALLDTADGLIGASGSALRVREEEGRSVLTFKGPVRASTMKLREEIETEVADGAALLGVLERLGFRAWFRYEKYREEFSLGGCIVAIDETPVGTFVEIEGDEPGVAGTARALGRTPADYVLESYRGLFARRCEEQGVRFADMLFGRPT